MISKKEKLKIGFLGVGWIGFNRMESLLKCGIADAVLIADLSEKNAMNAKKIAPDAVIVRSIDEMMRYALDGIVIATPSGQHFSQVMSALENNYHVFCQKPLARTMHEVESIVMCAREKNRLLRVDMSYRYSKAIQAIKQCIENGEIGKMYSIDLKFHNAYGPDKPWFFDPVQSGGGCVIDLGIHLVDIALWLSAFPDVERVSSTLFAGGIRKSGRSGDVEDYASITLNFSNDLVVNIACSWKMAAGCDAIINCTAHGTKGTVIAKNVNGSFYDFEAYYCKQRTMDCIYQSKDSWGEKAIIDWAQGIVSKGEYDNKAEQLLNVAKVIDQIYEKSSW